ncbi:MAG TPA: ATP-binding protein [Bacillota bacterium]|nr:ATP-binding protein [Bacillota bacterium]
MKAGKRGDRPTIGLLLHDIDDTVGYKVYLGACERARELGINIYFFTQGTGVRRIPDYLNITFEYAFARFDGLICRITPRTSMMTAEELEAFFKKFNLPLVNMVDNWEGVPSILFDDYQSMRNLIGHLIEKHGLKRIYFIRGPLDHYYACERYRAYCDIMNEYGWFNPELVSQPTDWKPNRQHSLAELIGELRPGKDFEAIVASNDDWALETINQLKKQGLKVPEDVAVVGFNNTIQGQSNEPPLTSVGPSFFEQGKNAVDILYRLILGQHVPEQITQPSELFIRQSCGCLDINDIIQDSYDFNELLPVDLDETALVNCVCHLFRENGLDCIVEYGEPIVAAVIDLLKNDASQKFFRVLNNAITSSINNSQAVAVWNNVLDLLQEWSSCQTAISYNRKAMDRYWKQARILLRKTMLLNKEKIVTRQKDGFWKLHMYISALIRIFDMQELIQYLIKCLPDFGFYSCYFVLFDDQQPYEFPNSKPNRSRLVLTYNGDQPGIFNTDERLFPAEEFLPEELLNSTQPFNLIVTPLIFHNYQFGYIICDYRESSPLPYKMFWPQLPSCLRGIYLLKQRVEAEESLQQQKEELARSNAELQQFANIASHDLQEPLRKIVAFTGRLKLDSEGAFEQNRDYLARIQNATKRMQVLINGLLDYSRVTTKAQPFCEVSLNEIINDVLLDLEVKIAENKATIEVADLQKINADPLQMRQLFQNLISNAIKFHREGATPRIRIFQQLIDAKTVEFTIEDNGIGIEQVYYERIFQVFERLYSKSEYEGTGIGLAICKKIVDRHGGNIRVESKVGIGTKFIISIPCHQRQ